MTSRLMQRFESPERKGEFRATMGEFATGVVAVTALEPSESMPVGMVINSFTSVSLEPELVLFCVAHTSTSWPLIRSAGRFCVNILAESQRETSARLAASGTQKFRTVPWTLTGSGIPVLDGAIGWLECAIEMEYPAGDHKVIIARVHHLDSPHRGAPLVFFRGSYGRYAAL
jgi:flavin reductase (DIM6/NTAB) family NADH-FMN oxidoreductase RutF